MQEGYSGCAGCGRLFKLDDDNEIAEFGLHDCDDPYTRLIVPANLSLLNRILDRLWRHK